MAGEVTLYDFTKAIGESVQILVDCDANLTDAANLVTVWAYFKKDLSLSDAAATFSKATDTSGISVYDLANKIFLIDISPSDTNVLTDTTTLWADVKVKTVGLKVYSLCTIKLILERRASQRIT